jgi:hypothetical protein
MEEPIFPIHKNDVIEATWVMVTPTGHILAAVWRHPGDPEAKHRCRSARDDGDFLIGPLETGTLDAMLASSAAELALVRASYPLCPVYERRGPLTVKQWMAWIEAQGGLVWEAKD